MNHLVYVRRGGAWRPCVATDHPDTASAPPVIMDPEGYMLFPQQAQRVLVQPGQEAQQVCAELKRAGFDAIIMTENRGPHILGKLVHRLS